VSRRPAAPDQAQRDAAVRERERNVLIDAGAGTGKTTLLVDRLVAMVAPEDDRPPVPLRRLAAITFTRKAAGELRLRIREALLRALAERGLPAAREHALRAALAELDTAHVGTIHAFADRLLRLRPVEATLSPAYEIVEDDADLVAETWERLIHAVQTDTLAAALAGTPAAALAAEATRTLVLALGAGLRVESVETERWTLHGLQALVGAFVRTRDVPPTLRDPTAFDAAAFRAAASAFVQAARGVAAATPGGRWIVETAGSLAAHGGVEEPVVLFREVHRALRRRPRQMRKRHEFGGDESAWKAWKALDGGRPSVLEALRAPLDRWLATRLVRLAPVVVTLYEQVKARRRVLDSLDLLLRLRDLLARDRAVRADLQALFDHVFVDEFQDTDPLQAEIVLFLGEQGQAAARWDQVVLRPGALTLVGDPKQSIYRFRRADIATYDRVRALVARGPHLPVTLSANFRSVPALVPWLNDRFERILGRSPDGRPFDPATGTVYYQPLVPGRADEGTAPPDDDAAPPGETAPATGHPAAPPVHVVPAEFADDRKRSADEYRRLEAEALARYLRWLVEASGVQVADPLTRRRRPVRYGDVAVLAIATTNLLPLFDRLDAEDVPYTSRGGTLFLADPLVRQFLLGLRAVADRDDGVAEAALLRPPFFALDPADLLRERAARPGGDGAAAGEDGGAVNGAAGDTAEDDGLRRVRQARALVAALRRDRLARPPGATARDLLERTALGRAVARGPNAAQRLARLREVCLVLEQVAAREGLDYDAATARLRGWALTPVQLDPPLPVGGEAVQVLTVHQAKGLEFPVVVLWDSRAGWDAFLSQPAWRIERDGRGWAMTLDGLAWEEPPGLDLRGTERAYGRAERRRLVYVAATRARDLLVVPVTGGPRPGQSIHADLIAGEPETAVRRLDVYRAGTGAAWSRALPAAARPAPGDGAALFAEVAGRWEAAVRQAARPRFQPVGVAEAARAADEVAPALRPARFGPVFGATVHQAIGLLLREPALGPAEAVRIAAAHTGLTGDCACPPLAEATADVARAWQALAAEGLARPPGPDLRLEYPVAGPGPAGTLIAGYADLVAVTGDRLDVLDFKTDPPPPGPVEAAYPEYVRQVRLYAELLEAAGLLSGRRLRCGLLFTGDGRIRWLIDYSRHE
jgi:ATP-dependent helicase/nuclease subunit A